VKLELQLEAFAAAGNEKYTQKAFDAACDKIAKLINGPSNLVAIAIEATGTPKEAADAIMKLGQGDAPDITAFLALSPIRQGAHLAKLAAARTKRTAAEEDEPPRKRNRVEEEDEPPEPLCPLPGANRTNDGLGDDVPPDVWFDRFEKQIMNKKLPH
jgi:hypothetical protein